MRRSTRDKPRRRILRFALFAILALTLLAGGVRAYLPVFARDYVNRTLDRNPMYAGRIGKVEIHLWRGAYSIHDIRLSKTTGLVPVPFFSANEVDFAVEWKALLHGRVVGRVLMKQPELNFVDSPADAEKQTGQGAPWLAMIRDLFPFAINSVVLQDGGVHFRSYQPGKPFDVYLSHLEAGVEDLTNIRQQTKPLVTTVQAKALAMDSAKVEFKMVLDPFSYRPTFHLALRILGLDVTKINDLALAYGKFDFQRGWFDLVVETDAKEGSLNGYLKPLFRDLKVFSLAEDFKTGNILQFFWQALVGATTRILTNPSRNQFGTLIPFTGDASGSTTQDILATIGNILRNAFVRAYLPRLEGGQEEVDGLRFEAPDFTTSLSASDTP